VDCKLNIQFVDRDGVKVYVYILSCKHTQRSRHFAVVVFTTESTYRQRIEQSFVPARSMFPVIRSVHLSIAFKANIAHKKWAIIKYKYMLRATTKDWLRLHLFKQFHKELQLTTWPPCWLYLYFYIFPSYRCTTIQLTSIDRQRLFLSYRHWKCLTIN